MCNEQFIKRYSSYVQKCHTNHNTPSYGAAHTHTHIKTRRSTVSLLISELQTQRYITAILHLKDSKVQEAEENYINTQFLNFYSPLKRTKKGQICWAGGRYEKYMYNSVRES